MRRKSGSWDPKIREHKDELYTLNAWIDILNQRLNERELDFERLKEVIEDNENDKFGFIYTVEEYLKNIDFSLEPPPTIDSVGKLSRKSDEGEKVSNKKMKELQWTNELLLGELRKANEKYLNEWLS